MVTYKINVLNISEGTKCVEAAIKKACIAIHESVDVLNSLDSIAGDGDCGSTLKIGADSKFQLSKVKAFSTYI